MIMKKLLIILLLFVSGHAISQGPPTGSYTNIAQRYNWLAGYFRALGLPVGCDTAFTTGQWRGAGAVYFDSCDVKLYVWTGIYWKEQGGSGIGAIYSGYGTFKVNDSTLRADTTVGVGLISWPRYSKLKDSIADIYQIKGNYITALTGDVTAAGPGSVTATLSNTGVSAGSYSVPNITVDAKGRVTNISTGPTIPAQFNPIAGTNMSLSGTYPNITFNASGGGGGSDGGIHGVYNGFGLGKTNDSTLFADTIPGQVFPWSHYYKYKDSADATFQIKGNYITALTGDVTASGPGSAAATLATVNGNVGSFTNANLTVNAKGLITAASNGSAGTSYDPLNILGTLYTNNTWNSTIRGTDITEAGGVTATDSSGFLILKNGAANFTQTANIKRSLALGIVPYFTNLEYWSFYIRFYVREKGALAVGITSTAANNLTADAIGYVNTITGQSNFIATSASNLSTTENDQCEMKVERDGFRTSISVRNITTNSAWITTLGAFSLPLTNTPHTTGQFAIFSYSGWYAIDSVGIHSKAPTYPDLAVIGTSKTEGKNGTPQTRYITKLQTRFNVVEHAGIAETTEEWISNYWELLAMRPKQVILENPCNDLRFGINVDSTKARMYRIERAFRDQGAAVYHLDAIYETNSSPANWLTYLYATRSADSIIYVRVPTAASGALDADGIHPTEVGQDIIYQTIIQSGKIKFGIAPETGNQTAILNQSGSSQIADFDITGTGRVRGFFRVGPQASGTTTFEVSTAANNNVKIYNGGGVNSISSLVDNNGSFTQMYLQASALSFFTSGVQALSLVTSGEATFSGKVNVGCTGCSGTLPFTATGATNQVMSFGYNGTYQQLIFGNSGGSQGRKIRQLASEYDFSVYTTGSVVIPAIEISTTGATTINQSGLALTTNIRGDNDANLFNANGTDDKINIGTGTSTAKVGVLSITEQLRLQYDASNYLQSTTTSNGSTTLNLVGTNPVLTISDSLTLTGIGQNIVDTTNWGVLVRHKTNGNTRWMNWAFAGGGSGMTNPITTTGDIIYSSSGTTPARLGIGSTNQVLQVVGGIPAWGNVVVSGTYTPTETDVANVSASTPLTFHYSRNGNEVTLTGEAIITPAVSATNTSVSFSLPSGSTSNFTSGGDVGGSGAARENTTRVVGTLSPDTTNDIINFQFTSINTSAHVISFTCIYTIVP